MLFKHLIPSLQNSYDSFVWVTDWKQTLSDANILFGWIPELIIEKITRFAEQISQKNGLKMIFSE